MAYSLTLGAIAFFLAVIWGRPLINLLVRNPLGKQIDHQRRHVQIAAGKNVQQPGRGQLFHGYAGPRSGSLLLYAAHGIWAGNHKICKTVAVNNFSVQPFLNSCFLKRNNFVSLRHRFIDTKVL